MQNKLVNFKSGGYLSASLQQNGLLALAARCVSNEASFQTKPYKLHKLDSGPPTEVTLKRDDALKYYHQMQVIIYF